MLNHDIEIIDTVLAQQGAFNILTTEDKGTILHMAARGEIMELKEFLETHTVQYSLTDLTKALNTKRSLVNTQVSIDYKAGAGLSASEFSKLLDKLLSELQRLGYGVPDAWKDLTYWKKILKDISG